MDITSVNGNDSWEFHFDMVMGTYENGVADGQMDGRTDGRTEPLVAAKKH